MGRKKIKESVYHLFEDANVSENTRISWSQRYKKGTLKIKTLRKALELSGYIKKSSEVWVKKGKKIEI